MLLSAAHYMVDRHFVDETAWISIEAVRREASKMTFAAYVASQINKVFDFLKFVFRLALQCFYPILSLFLLFFRDRTGEM